MPDDAAVGLGIAVKGFAAGLAEKTEIVAVGIVNDSAGEEATSYPQGLVFDHS